jgi:arsenate reductase
MSRSRRPRVLFLCTGNACRSQIAEGWLRHLGGERFEALSAGVEPHGLHPRAVSTMREVGVDISGQRSEDIALYLDAPPDLVVTVCDRAAARCPELPASTPVLHWPFPDPASASGDACAVAREFAAVRDAIRARIEDWLASGADLLASDG